MLSRSFGRGLAAATILLASAQSAPGVVTGPLFSPPYMSYDTAGQPYAIAVADLNGDHHPDLVTANLSDSTVSVLLGDGTGIFAPRVDYATGSGPVSVAVGDLNGDGIPDITTANYGAGARSGLHGISVLLG